MDTISMSPPGPASRLSARAHSSTTWRTVSASPSPTLKIVPAARSGCSMARTTPAVEEAAHDRPLPGHGLVRAVDVGIAEVGRLGVGGEHGLLGADDAVALVVDRRVLDQVGVLGDRHGQARGVVL